MPGAEGGSGLPTDGSSKLKILTLDIGNTNTLMGLYENGAMADHWRVTTTRDLTADQYAVELAGLFALRGRDFTEISDLAIASVVPPMFFNLKELARRYFGVRPLFINPGTDTGIKLDVEEPQSVGADRIANTIAAYDYFGGACIVVDFGTATNFDVVSEKGDFLGGAISPGIQIAMDALFKMAAALPRIKLVRPPSAIGRSTVTNMQAGILFGVAGQVDGIVRRIQAEFGQPIPVIATGGLAPLVAGECETVTAVDPLLTLTGIQMIYQRLRPDGPVPA